MKKSALALAVAAALVGFGSAAHADTTLYGSARVSVDYSDFNSNYARAPDGSLVRLTAGTDSWDVFNNASRLGVRGEEDLGGGLSAIYQYEFGVDVTDGGNLNSNRPKWVGLKGSSWGSVTIGTQWTPYYNVMGIADIFNSTKLFSSDSVYLGNTFGTRMDNSLIYTSPNWSGFSAQLMLVMNGQCPPTDPQVPTELRYGTGCGDTRISGTTNLVPANLSSDIDMWGISASYKNGPFFAGGTYMALEGPGFDAFFTRPTWDGEQYGLAFGYNAGPFAVTVNWERGDVNTQYFGQTDNFYLTGQYTFGNNVIRGAYGYMTPDDGQLFLANGNILTQSDINNWALGYQYNFSKRTRVWVEYIGQDVDSELVGSKQTVSIGTRVDF
ncbi:MAG: porin [Candidatus Contendobacter sp.]|nr:porin [Candidatus Contendobacter sp.]MDG4556539.1 porin [Candidatus Contendobacter sp.]